MKESEKIIENVTSAEYEHGFVTDLEQEFVPKGLNEDIIRLISSKKQEPQWLLDFRLDAFRKWQKMKMDFGGIAFGGVLALIALCIGLIILKRRRPL